jgi:dTDP-glucose 4,6-dehydratase
MKNVLVTGGAGFIGSECVRQLAAKSTVDRIIVLDKLTYAGNLDRIRSELNNKKVQFIHADILDVKTYSYLINEIDTLINFAAESHVDRSISDGIPFISTNVLGTYTLLEAARQNLDLKILHVSTDEVYGSIIDDDSIETDPLKPSSPYSASKASSDLIALAQRHTFGQKITVTRCCNNYGNWQDLEKVVPTFILSLIQGKKMPVYGSGLNSREWIHVSDHVSALFTVIESETKETIINIGTSDRMTNLDLAKIISENFGVSTNYIEYVSDRLGHDFRYALSSNLINNLGWSPKIKFSDGIADTISWYRSNYKLMLGEQ